MLGLRYSAWMRDDYARQMYGVPEGEKKLIEDLEFQVQGKKWGSRRMGMHYISTFFPAGLGACGIGAEPEADRSSIPGAGPGGIHPVCGEVFAGSAFHGI